MLLYREAYYYPNEIFCFIYFPLLLRIFRLILEKNEIIIKNNYSLLFFLCLCPLSPWFCSFPSISLFPLFLFRTLLLSHPPSLSRPPFLSFSHSLLHSLIFCTWVLTFFSSFFRIYSPSHPRSIWICQNMHGWHNHRLV